VAVHLKQQNLHPPWPVNWHDLVTLSFPALLQGTSSLTRVDPEPRVTSVRTLSPPRLPADHRHVSILRLPQHAPSLATGSGHRQDGAGGGVKLLRIDRGRVVVHPNGTLTQEGPSAGDVMGRVNMAGSPHRAGGRGEGEGSLF
jgi:hypothetical protein